MCGRFYVPEEDTAEELLAVLHAAEDKARRSTADFHLKRGEIRPGDVAAVLAPSRTRGHSAFPMRWGYRLDRRLVFNARSETAGEKLLFREGWQGRRCLVPAAAYFEWDHRVKPLQKYRFAPAGARLLYLAGLYRLTPEGAEFTVLTRPPTEALGQFHDRMPLMLPPEAHAHWLNPAESAETCLSAAVEDIGWAVAE